MAALAACAQSDPVCLTPANELPTIGLQECDGTPRDLAELNGSRASWLFLYSGA